MASPAKVDLNALDIVVVVVLLSLVLLVGIYAALVSNHLSLREVWEACAFWKKKASTPMEVALGHVSTEESEMVEGGSFIENETEKDVPNDDTTEMFLASRSMAWYFVGGSLFASNIGSEHFIGQAGDGARRGIAVAMYEWFAVLLIVLLGWVFGPIYIRAGVKTTPEFLEHRFNPWCRHYFSVLTCIMYILTKMSASIYGGAIILSQTLGWNLYASAGLCIALSCVYTICGGLRAVMYTDLFQVGIFVGGGFVVLHFTLSAVGGWSQIPIKLQESDREDFWHLFKPISDPDYPWTGMFFGQMIGSLWYWCCDFDIVQRVISAKNPANAKGGCLMAGVLKIIPPFIMVVPGIIAAILYPNILDKTQGGNPDLAYPVLMAHIMPPGVVGLMIASIMTAMMSSLDSVFNAGSAVFTNDIYKSIHPNATETRLKWVGRISTASFAFLSFCWIHILSGGAGLYRTVVEIQAYLTPPIGIVFLIGIFWKRANGPGALTGLVVGGLCGMGRLVLSLAVQETSANTSWTEWLIVMNFQHFAIILWLISGGLCVAVSLMTALPPARATELVAKWTDIFPPQDEVDARDDCRWVGYALNGGAVAIITTIVIIWWMFA